MVLIWSYKNKTHSRIWKLHFRQIYLLKIIFGDKINKANCMLGIIKRNFRGLRQDKYIMLYKSLVRSQLEYANSCSAQETSTTRLGILSVIVYTVTVREHRHISVNRPTIGPIYIFLPYCSINSSYLFTFIQHRAYVRCNSLPLFMLTASIAVFRIILIYILIIDTCVDMCVDSFADL